MKRFTPVLAMFVLLLSGSMAPAGWASLQDSGDQPWWNIFANRYRALTPEEERLQKFWHDYYHSLARFYQALDSSNPGSPIAGGGCPSGRCGPIIPAPVLVNPTLPGGVIPRPVAAWPIVPPLHSPPLPRPAGKE